MRRGMYHCAFSMTDGVVLYCDGTNLFDSSRRCVGHATGETTGAAEDPIDGRVKPVVVKRHWPHAGIRGHKVTRERDRAFSDAAAARAQGKPWRDLLPGYTSAKVERPASLRLVYGSGAFECVVVEIVRRAGQE